jgi:hypothetical protein
VLEDVRRGEEEEESREGGGRDHRGSPDEEETSIVSYLKTFIVYYYIIFKTLTKFPKSGTVSHMEKILTNRSWHLSSEALKVNSTFFTSSSI